MSARTLLAQALVEALPERYRVIPAADTPDAVKRPTILLWQSNVERLPQISHDRLRVSLDLWLLAPQEDPLAAETVLEEGLDDLIEALLPITWADWTTAERLTFGQADAATYHAYKLTLTSLASIEAAATPNGE